MSHLKVKGQSPGVIAVEITPDRDARWFAVVWAGAGFAMLAVFWYQFGAIFFRSPLALLLAAKQLGVDDGDHNLALRVDVAPLAADHYVILARST